VLTCHNRWGMGPSFAGHSNVAGFAFSQRLAITGADRCGHIFRIPLMRIEFTRLYGNTVRICPQCDSNVRSGSLVPFPVLTDAPVLQVTGKLPFAEWRLFAGLAPSSVGVIQGRFGHDTAGAKDAAVSNEVAEYVHLGPVGVGGHLHLRGHPIVAGLPIS